MGDNAQKIAVLSNNLIRYSEQEAQDGSYLNAVLILSQATNDVNKKGTEGVLSPEEASPILNRLDRIKTQYVNEAKHA